MLKAPLEVRDNILRLLLGDGLIHIQYITEGDIADSKFSEMKSPDIVPAYSGLCSAFCVAKKSEQEAYDEANLSSGKVQATKGLNDIATCKDRHKNCLMCGDKKEKIAVTAERLTFTSNLSVLAVCRLLYEESNNVLWQTNTFSFDDSLSLTKFFLNMNVSQKHKLKKLHIRMDMAINAEKRKLPYINWRVAIAARMLAPLQNLSIIHLSFDQWSPNNGYRAISHAQSRAHVKIATDAFLNLRALPWKDEHDASRGKHVTVIISDDASTETGHHTRRWTKAEKLESAETLRASLAAPNSAEIYAAEKVSEKVAQEVKMQCLKRQQIQECIRQIDSLPPRLKKAKEEAEKRRADADRSESTLIEALRLRREESSVKRFRKSMLFRDRLADRAEARLESQTVYLAVLEARLIKFQAKFKHPDGEDSSETIGKAEKA